MRTENEGVSDLGRWSENDHERGNEMDCGNDCEISERVSGQQSRDEKSGTHQSIQQRETCKANLKRRTR